MYDAIILLGPPGAGKGTVGSALEQEGYYHYSTGDHLRSIDESSDLGKRVRTLIDAGNRISDDDMCALAQEHLKAHVKEGMLAVYDGLPRTIAQVGLIEEFTNIQQALYLQASRQTCLDRILKRGEDRADDKKEVIIKRFRDYTKHTTPIIAEYRRRGLLDIVDAEEEATRVLADVLETIHS